MNDHEFSERIVAMTETLYRVCYSQLPRAHDREDAVQECLLRAWRGRAQVREPRHLQTWVCRILLNVCHDLQKRNKRDPEAVDPGEFGVFDLLVPSAPEGVDEALHDALLTLSEELRMPLVLHYLEGFKISEVADILGIPEGTVKSRMQRGRMALSEILRHENGYSHERYAC